MNDYQRAYQRLTNRIYKYDHIEDVYKDLEVLGELVDKATQKNPIGDLHSYEKALRLACELWGEGDCPIEQELEFNGCLKDNCKSECVKCWFNYFLEKADERS